MREIDKMLEKIAKKADTANYDTAIDNCEDLEALIMQKKLGNSLTTMMIYSQEDDNLISDLSAPIGEDKKDSGKAMKELLPRHGDVKNEEYPEKHADLVFPTGVVHIGSNKKDKQAVLVTEESRKDKKKDPLRNEQKTVYENRPVDKSEGTQVSVSQNWRDGSVALISSFNKKPSKIVRDTKKVIKEEDDSGNLKEVLPFLDQEKEMAEKKELQKMRSDLNLAKAPNSKDQMAKSKSEIDLRITKKGLITEKKKSKEMELSKKIGNSLKRAKEPTQKPIYEDSISIILRRKAAISKQELDFGLIAKSVLAKKKKPNEGEELKKRQEKTTEDKSKMDDSAKTEQKSSDDASYDDYFSLIMNKRRMNEGKKKRNKKGIDEGKGGSP